MENSYGCDRQKWIVKYFLDSHAPSAVSVRHRLWFQIYKVKAVALVPIVLDGNACQIPKDKYTLPCRSMGARKRIQSW